MNLAYNAPLETPLTATQQAEKAAEFSTWELVQQVQSRRNKPLRNPQPSSFFGETVEESVEVNTPAATKFILVTATHSVVFTVDGDKVIVTRKSSVGPWGPYRTVMSKEAAREEYAKLKDQGYTPF